MRRISDSMKRIKKFGAASAVLALFILGLAVVATPSAQAQTFYVYRSFAGPPGDGGEPVAGLAQGPDGNFYGTTKYGGDQGLGAVFELSSDGNGGWNYSVLYNIPVNAYAYPYSITLNAAGDVYITSTGNAGINTGGVVFELVGGILTHSWAFTGGTDGCYPTGGLIEDSSGNLYGTTNGCGTSNLGTVFKLDPNLDSPTILHNFAGSAKDGASPAYGSLLLSGTSLYGVTTAGGSAGCGVAYSLTIANGKIKILHSFMGFPADGCAPEGALAMDAKGNLFGTTYTGGVTGSYNAGTVWKRTKTGVETFFSLNGGTGGTGAGPTAGVVLNAAGNLYGTASKGGAYGYGTLFKMDSNLATFTPLHYFTNSSDGATPVDTGGVILDSTGNLYGTAQYGGTNGFGVIWGYFP
jgi:uncharacterized repeat protein (TIGR03803 family)